jgi:hypothetical protein
MANIKMISDDKAEGLLEDLYQTGQKNLGYVANYIKAFSIHPEVYDAWTKLISAIRSKMRLRRYELVTFASAMALECRY